MKIDIDAFDGAGSIKNHPERSPRGHFGIELLERTGGGVTRIGKQGQTSRFALFVQFLEAGLIQISFAADFENFWGRAAQLMGDRSNCFNVLGDIVTDQTIATSGCVFEFAIFVHHRHGHAVDFWLDHHRNFLVRQEASDPFVEVSDFLFRIGVVETKHRHAMVNLSESLERFAPDALSR